MIIEKTKKYYVNLYSEPKKYDEHTRIQDDILEFTGADLIHAIISAGMPDIYLTKKEKRNRSKEIAFKIHLFETFIAADKSGILSWDKSRAKYIDSSEKGAISYWIGMILTTMLGQKKYNYNFLVHLSMIDLFSKDIKVKSYSFMSANGKITHKSPDLIAINTANDEYGVFEAKGYSRYASQNMKRGYIQAKSIKTINGNPPKDTYVAMTLIEQYTKLSIVRKDPEGEGLEIDIDRSFLHLYHFLPIVELINELNPYEIDGRMCGSLEHNNFSYSISIPAELYKIIAPITQKDDDISSEEIIKTIEKLPTEILWKSAKLKYLSVD